MKKGGIAIIVIIIVIFLFLLGCGIAGFFIYNNFIKEEVNEKAAETIIEEAIENETGSNVDVNIDDSEGSFQIEDEDTSLSISADEEWPSNLPSYVPQFTYGTQVSSTYVDGEDEEGWTMAFESADDNAYDDYKADLEQSGWTINSNIEAGGLKIFSASKGESSLSFTYDTVDKGVTLSVGI